MSVTKPVAESQRLLEVEGLETVFPTREGLVRAVDGVSFYLDSSETLGIVGESGSGKSVTALSVMRLLSPPGRIVRGSVRFRGRDLVTAPEAEMAKVRGGEIAMVFQDPMTSLNPVFPVGWQVTEPLRLHPAAGRTGDLAEAATMLSRLGMPEAEHQVRRYPHELSGGMRQRAMIAMGLTTSPSVLIADEPTTALDVTIQAQILELLREVNTRFATATVLITHNLGVVAGMCQRLMVMYAGRVVEEGPTEDVFAHPSHPYTWALLRSVPRLDAEGKGVLRAIQGQPPDLARLPDGCAFQARCPFAVERCRRETPVLEAVGTTQRAACWITQAGAQLPQQRDETIIAAATEQRAAAGVQSSAPLLQVTDLATYFPIRTGLLQRTTAQLRAVDGVTLGIQRGETLGLVGESGCGKTTLGRTILRLVEPTRGRISFQGEDITQLARTALRRERREMAMIFQDPYASLDAKQTVAEIVGEPLTIHRLAQTKRQRDERVGELLSLVGLSPRFGSRYPSQFSGGQRQRIGIARALALSPSLIVCDEPVSSLDLSVQAQIVNLLQRLQEELHLTYLFIAHDLSVVRHISDRVAVMYLGKVVEVAPAADLYRAPLHPYTTSLLSAVPIADPAVERERRRIILRGDVPSAVNPPTGCRFRTRCFRAKERCAHEEPTLETAGTASHQAACFFPVN